MLYFVKAILFIFAIIFLVKTITTENTKKAYNHLYDTSLLSFFAFYIQPII